MSDAQRLALVRGVHTAIYLVMVTAIVVLLYAGATGYDGPWLWVSLGLLLVGNGMKCPLTAIAVRYGAETGHAFDTFLPERVTQSTFRVFGSLMVVGLMLVAARWTGLLH